MISFLTNASPSTRNRTILRGIEAGFWFCCPDGRIRLAGVADLRDNLIGVETGRAWISERNTRPLEELRGTIAHRRAVLTLHSAERSTDHLRSQHLIGKQTGAVRETVNRRLQRVGADIQHRYQLLERVRTVNAAHRSRVLREYHLKAKSIRSRGNVPALVKQTDDGCVALVLPLPNAYRSTGDPHRCGGWNRRRQGPGLGGRPTQPTLLSRPTTRLPKNELARQRFKTSPRRGDHYAHPERPD